MPNDGFNGSFVTFAGANLGSLTGVDFTSNAAKVDVTDSDDTRHTYEVGIPDEELTVSFVGTPSGVGVGSEGSCIVTWSDGVVSVSSVNYKCNSIKASGNLDGAISGSATLVPSPS
jgi:hypothetical protein